MKENLRKTLESLPNIFKYILAGLIVFFISLLCPSNTSFKYDFTKGQPWSYEDLRAPFDYAILKPSEVIKSDRANFEENFSPYYYQDNAIAKNQKRKFSALFQKEINQISDSSEFSDVKINAKKYQEEGLDIIDRVYDKGIIEPKPEHISKGNNLVINIISGNTTSKTPLSNIPTKETIDEYLSDTLPFLPLQDPDFLYVLLNDFFIPNIVYSDSLSQKLKAIELQGFSMTEGLVKKGELVVLKGNIVTDEIYQKLHSYRAQYDKEVVSSNQFSEVFIGYVILTGLIVAVFFLFLQFRAGTIFNNLVQLIFVLMWLPLFAYLVYLVEGTINLSAYLIPFCIVPIVIKNFYDRQVALFTHIVIVLIASFLSSLGYEFTFVQILAGIVAVYNRIETRDMGKFFMAIFFIFLTYAVAFLGLSLIQEGSFSKIDWSIYSWLFLNAFLILLAYPLIPLIERIFGFTSSITLVELSDMNRPLLKEMSIKAPGTLQHSLQVANLSEAAASAIGANELLVKVAALYHDIGKMHKPNNFIENQNGQSPHDNMTYFESAKAIIEHITEGEKMAKKHGLPKLIRDFITTHHGTTRVEYFYRKHLAENPDTPVDESLFRYPGPKPSTKEQTIMMIADSLEAASKSLKSPTEKDINGLVDKIIEGKIQHGQLSDSPISFSELDQCKTVFKSLLKSIHHVRIEYPDEPKK